MTMRGWWHGVALLGLMAASLPAGAETFLLCRFPGGAAPLRILVEERGLAIELPGSGTWQESEEMAARRDPLAAGFAGPVPGWRQGPAHDRFSISLNRQTGEARLLFSRRPDPAQVEACRAATATSPAAPSDQPPSLPPPCDLPVPAGTVTGTCEVQRLKF
ncbi:hypothetical protein JMJ55_11930 [Belnapia sp. T6]|uniref:Uncharacterized protein n=1 Tax=Belnapia mucosa TaxID=2804532 RepID=A0ABS1V4K4_9PROT|nr:hypothetical protein [Belnapia mucosa]MBL6456036.1 hypothetical protein [Belnapia mucosa]